MKKICLVLAVIGTCSCSFQSSVIDARRHGFIETEQDLARYETDYMTQLRLKKGARPLDQDYIILSHRLIRQMVDDPVFADKKGRTAIALRDVLSYHPSTDINPAIIHEYAELAMINTRVLWVIDGSTPYEYILDIELSEVPSMDDSAEENALGMMLVLFNPDGSLLREWFGILKREKGSKRWF